MEKMLNEMNVEWGNSASEEVGIPLPFWKMHPLSFDSTWKRADALLDQRAPPKRVPLGIHFGCLEEEPSPSLSLIRYVYDIDPMRGSLENIGVWIVSDVEKILGRYLF